MGCAVFQLLLDLLRINPTCAQELLRLTGCDVDGLCVEPLSRADRGGALTHSLSPFGSSKAVKPLSPVWV